MYYHLRNSLKIKIPGLPPRIPDAEGAAWELASAPRASSGIDCNLPWPVVRDLLAYKAERACLRVMAQWIISTLNLLHKIKISGEMDSLPELDYCVLGNTRLPLMNVQRGRSSALEGSSAWLSLQQKAMFDGNLEAELEGVCLLVCTERPQIPALSV